MQASLATLLCVGVQLLQFSGAQGPLHPPHIQAVPGNMILRGEPVTIQCSDTPRAENYRISKKKVTEAGEKTQTMNRRTLTIYKMTAQLAGLYVCSYQRGHIWSLPSQPLNLVMTGAYKKPFLLAAPGSTLSSGQTVRLNCVSNVKFEIFSFHQGSGVHTSQPASLTQDGRWSQASFHVNLFDPTQAGPYRCYGYFQNHPYVWSFPSDSYRLQVKEPLSPPDIQAVPGNIILQGEPVTIQCSGPSEAESYRISKKEVSEAGEKTQTMNRRTLTIYKMTAQLAGVYVCSYQRDHIWSLPSQPLTLVMTGAYKKPFLLDVSGHTLRPGQAVQLNCASNVKFEIFSFHQGSGVYISQPASLTQDGRWSQASFHVNLVDPTQAGPYRCLGYFQNHPYVWSFPSDSYRLQVKEPLSPPDIQAVPGNMILHGKPVTIQCFGPPEAENYRISKKEVSEAGEKTQTMNKRTLTITQMTAHLAGLYVCSYQRGHIWSPPSQLLTLVMTGAYDKPSLLAMPSPTLSPGQTVQLDCVSSVKFEMFFFSQGNGIHTFQPASLTQAGTGSQASFNVKPVTPTQVGSYRCFGYFQNSPYVWSHPSDLLWLQVKDTPFTAPSRQPALSTEAPHPLLVTEHPTYSTEFPSIFTATGQAGGGGGERGTTEGAGGEGSAVGFSVVTAVRLTLATLVLLIMLAMLLEAWLSRKIPILAPH